MIKQIAAKTIDKILTRHFSKFALDQICKCVPAEELRASVAMKRLANKANLLPPIMNKPTAPSEPAPMKLQQVLPDVEEGFLLMGDVVALIAIETQGMQSVSGVIIGDGVAHNFLDCVPTSSFQKNEKIPFRLCLFRIEPVRQYGYSNMRRTYIKLENQNDENIEKLKAAEEEEQNDNEAETELSYGKFLTFGERIQLRHVHSNSFITTSKEVSKQRGCLQVILDPLGNEGSWFEIKSCSPIRQDGETIRYADNFSLTLNLDNAKYYLHMGVPKLWKEDQDFELNASSSYTWWQVRKFISHIAIKENPDFVATGDSFRIQFKQTEGFLSVTPRDIDEILPEPEGDQPRAHKIKERKESDSKVYIEKHKSCLSVWELIRENPFLGGLAEKDSIFRIKHVATGLLLSLTKTGGLTLSYERNSEMSLFKIIQEPNDNIYHTFDTLVKIESVALNKILSARVSDLDEDLLFTETDYSQVPLSTTENRKQDTKTSFVLYDEPESSTIYIYQISSLMPKVFIFFKYIKFWGCIKRGANFNQNFEVAKSTESDLESQVILFIRILSKIQKRVLYEGKNLDERQETLRLTGFLEILLKFAKLIDRKLELPAKFPVERMPKNFQKSKVKMILEGIKGAVKPEFLQFPGVVGIKYLMRLAKEIYRIIFYSIRNNVTSCMELQKYQDFLCSQLFSYETEVGILLKELYKLSSGTIAKANSSLFKVWIDLIKPISQKDENVDEQIVTLKILSSLSNSDCRGIPGNQNHLARNFFSTERGFIILKGLVVDNIPYLGLYAGSGLAYEDFVKNNPDLKDPDVEQSKENILIINPWTVNANLKLVTYFSSFFSFLVSICMTRNQKNCILIQEQLELSYEFLYLTISNKHVHCKLRTSCLRLLWSMFFDKDSKTLLSETQQRCYLWDSENKSLEDSLDAPSAKMDILERIHQKPLILDQTIDWIRSLWTSNDLPISCFENESSQNQARFIIGLIRFSKDLLNYGYVNYDFAIEITPYILTLIDRTEKPTQSHWTSQIRYRFNKLKKDRLQNELIEIGIEFFQVKFYAQLDTEVKNKLIEYCKNQETGVDDKNDDSKEDQTQSPKEKKSKKVKENKKSKKNKKSKNKNSNEDEEIEEISLDTVLLNLLFTNSEASLKDKIINLLLSNLDLNNKIIQALNDMVLLPKCPVRDAYLEISTHIKECEKGLNTIMFLDPEVIQDDQPYENPEIHIIKIQLQSRMKSIKSFLRKKNSKSDRLILQKICKNLLLHKLCLRFFKEEWPWVEKNNKKAKLRDNVLGLYRIIIRTLENFCFVNTENQEIIYEELDSIECFKINSIGVKILIAEVIKCRRNNPASLKIIDKIFKSLSQKPNPMESPEDIMIIKSLIHDESLKFYYTNQTTVIKSLLATRNLHTIFSCETSWDLSKYSSRSIKFFSMMIDIIACCTIFNDYATHQARRMMPFKVMIREMKNTSMLLIKKAYLHFIFYVFFMKSENIDRVLPEHEIEDILETVILEDISNYKMNIDHLKVIALKGMYEPISVNKDHEKKVQVDGKKQKNAKIDSLTREQAEGLEWWKYINSHRPDTPRLSTGLICVIKDITQEYKMSNSFTDNIAMILYKIKIHLQGLIDELFIIMLECSEINMEFMIQEITLTMMEIPNFVEEVKETEEQDKEIENTAYKKLLEGCQDFIVENHLPFEDFQEAYLTYEEDKISKIDFIFLIKKQLKRAVTINEIELVCKLLDPGSMSDITITRFRSDIKALFISTPYIVRKERIPVIYVDEPTHEMVSGDFRDFVELIEKQHEVEENDISLMVGSVKTQLIDPALEQNNTAVLVNFIENLSLAFFRPEHKIYLIKILNSILAHELGKQDESNNVETIQNLYSNENVVEICFEEFSKDKLIDNTLAALDLLIDLVRNGNMSSKEKILNYLKTSGFGIFSYIRVQFREVQDLLSNAMSKGPLKRRKTLSDDQIIVKAKKKNFASIKLTGKILLFLQSCCNNCYLPFQEFLQIQNPENPVANIDLVSEMGQFLIRMEGIPELKHGKELSNDLSDLAIQCLRSLTDCCQGPCHINQILLGQRRRLYEFMNWLFSIDNPNFTEPSVWFSVYKEGVNFLNALIEANTNLKNAKIFIRETQLETLSNHSALIWKQIIEGRERIIYQDNQGMSCCMPIFELTGRHLEDFEKEVIEIGFNINILILTLEYLHPKEFRIKLGNIIQAQTQGQTDMDKQVNSNIRPGFKELFYERITRFFTHKVQDVNFIDFAKAQDFYYSNISSVEINNRGELAKLFFRVPTMCRYFTEKSQRELITNVNRVSLQEKLEDFCNKSKIYEVEMIHQQKIARYPLLDYFLSKWPLYGIISFIMIICINFILLSTVKRSEDSNDWEFDSSINSKGLLASVSVIQIILASLVYICYLIEYLPVIKYRSTLQSKGSQKEKYQSSYFNRIKGTELMNEVLIRTLAKENTNSISWFTSIKVILTDFECFYNLTYLVISILCWKWALLYSILLLDLIKRNKDLKNILRSITLNSNQLVLIGILGIIVIYIFSIVGFLSFSSYYSDDFNSIPIITYCDNLVNCFISTMFTGIRQNGGIGDALIQPERSDSQYWSLMIYNILYFAIVINVLFSIVFGIIIDTFGELRDRNQAEQKDIQENCFICGNQRFLFEIRRINWGFHINMEHNPSAYLAFLIYIRHKDIEACKGTEKYVKEKMEKNDTGFFPLTALSLKTGEDDKEEELDEVKEKIQKILNLAGGLKSQDA